MLGADFVAALADRALELGEARFEGLAGDGLVVQHAGELFDGALEEGELGLEVDAVRAVVHGAGSLAGARW